jgi:hypothetical protein
VQSNFTQPFFRTSQPGAMFGVMWEGNLVDGGSEQCYRPAGFSCLQGNVPPYGVVVHGADDVRTALAFAQRSNIRVVVKSTGHEYHGRSTAANALMLWMHPTPFVSGRGEQQILPAYTACDGDSPTVAVNVTSGTQFLSVFNAVKAAGYDIVSAALRV